MIQQPHLFVVDDEAVISATLALILRSMGCSATAFTDPLDALHSAKSDYPDLLLSDVMMPQLTGVDLAIQMLQVCPGCKVLLFSGQASTNSLLEEALERGHDFRLLQKPLHPTALLAEIAGMWQQLVPQHQN